MSALRQRMMEDMQLHGYSAKTQDAYVRAVRGLAKYYHRSPAEISQEEVRAYFLWMVQEKKVAQSTFRIHLNGIKFFVEKTLKNEWDIFKLLRPQKRKKLPVVLSADEVKLILSHVKVPKIRMALMTIYACGLRLSEGVNLNVQDIDGKRMTIHIRNGKGGRDRYIPLPQRLLVILRDYWSRYKPSSYLFPGKDKRLPLCYRTLQKTFKMILRESGIDKNASIHTLRHSYATHLLERGVDIRIIQELLGHKSPQTTAIYAHLTERCYQSLAETVDKLLADL